MVVLNVGEGKKENDKKLGKKEKKNKGEGEREGREVRRKEVFRRLL